MSNESVWNALDAGEFFDHIRLMGFWGFRAGAAGVPYFSFALRYYRIPIIIVSVVFVLLSFLHLILKRKSNEDKDNLRVMVLVITIVSLILAVGSKGPFGYIYNFLFIKVPIFVIFREPYAKFMPLFVFSVCFGVMYTLESLVEHYELKGQKISGLILSGVLVMGLMAYPIFFHGIVHVRRWMAGSSSNVVRVPNYWWEAKEEIEGLPEESKIFVVPFNSYVSRSIWHDGGGVSGNIIDYLVKGEFGIGWDNEQPRGGEIVNSLFFGHKDVELSKLLRFLSFGYILFENDLEWRYSEDVLSPSSNLERFGNSRGELVANFGRFTQEYLSGLPNEREDDSRKNELYYELTDKPALSLYSVRGDEMTPKIYIPDNVSAIAGSDIFLDDLLYVVDTTGKQIFIGKGDIRESGIVSSSAQVDYLNVPKKNAGELSTILWDYEEWDWPFGKYDPRGYRYKAVRIIELIKTTLTFSDERKLVELITLAAKRVDELDKYILSEDMKVDLAREALRLNQEVWGILQNIDEPGALKNYISRFHYFLSREIYVMAENRIPVELVETQYKLMKKVENRYTGLIGSPKKIEDILEQVKDADKLFVKLSDRSLKEVSQDLEIKLGESETNVVYEVEELSQNDPFLYHKIDDWSEISAVDLSFDFEVKNSEMEVRIIEEFPDFS
ncbi:MAG: hypothetical protein PVJ52_03420, partial [Candidatus Woesebacteria bacterium]